MKTSCRWENLTLMLLTGAAARMADQRACSGRPPNHCTAQRAKLNEAGTQTQHVTWFEACWSALRPSSINRPSSPFSPARPLPPPAAGGQGQCAAGPCRRAAGALPAAAHPGRGRGRDDRGVQPRNWCGSLEQLHLLCLPVFTVMCSNGVSGGGACAAAQGMGLKQDSRVAWRSLALYC